MSAYDVQRIACDGEDTIEHGINLCRCWPLQYSLPPLPPIAPGLFSNIETRFEYGRVVAVFPRGIAWLDGI